jgi:hypothetical protein
MRISQVFEAWGSAYTLVASKAQEDAAYVGCNTWLTALQQLGQAAALQEIYSKMMDVRGKTHSVFLEFAAVIFVPMGLGAAKTFTDEETIEWLHSNVGNLCQLATLVTAVALLYLGQTAYATTTLAIMTVGYLNRHHYLPLPIEKACSKVSPWIGNISALMYSHWIVKLFALTELIDHANVLLFKRHQVPYDEAQHHSHLENLQQFEDIYARKVAVEVNPEHVWIAPFPHSSRTEFAPLIEFCDDFQWPVDRLLRDLNQDPRWHRSPLKKSFDLASDKLPIALEYARTTFKKMVHDVQNQCIETGEVLDYGVLKSYLGYITDHLHQAPKEIQDEIMLQLAIEGGDYCGPGIYYQLETAATTLLLNQVSVNREERARLPLKQRILLLLQQERLRVMEGFHDAINKINPGLHFLKGGKKDIHGMNYTIQLIGQDFGLPDQGASQDKTATVSKVEQWFFPRLLGVYSKHLWTGLEYRYIDNRQKYYEQIEGYTVNRILDAIQKQMGLPLFGNSDVYGWAREWNETLEDRILAGEFESFGAKIDSNFLKAMLVDMGILRIKSHQITAAPGSSIPQLGSRS